MVKRAGGALLLSITIDPSRRARSAPSCYVPLRDLILVGRLRGRRTAAGQSHAGARPGSVAHHRDRSLRPARPPKGLIESRVGAGAFVSKALAGGAAAVARKRRPQTAAARRPPRLSRAMTQAVGRFAERPRLPLERARLHDGAAGLRSLPDGAMGTPGRETLAQQPQRRDGLRRRRSATRRCARRSRCTCAPIAVFVRRPSRSSSSAGRSRRST